MRNSQHAREGDDDDDDDDDEILSAQPLPGSHLRHPQHARTCTRGNEPLGAATPLL